MIRASEGLCFWRVVVFVVVVLVGLVVFVVRAFVAVLVVMQYTRTIETETTALSSSRFAATQFQQNGRWG